MSIAPLLTSETASFGFYNLKYACSSIRQNKSSAFFAEVLRTIICSENAINIENDVAHVSYIYKYFPSVQCI